MQSISDPFIKKPVMTTLLTISVIVCGIYSYLHLPISNLPKVDYPVLSVNVVYSGANPATMASAVASPLEKEFLKIENLKTVTSINTLGRTALTLVFDLSKDINAASTDVQAAISRAQTNLPTDLTTQPSYTKTDPNSSPIFYIGVASNAFTQGQLYEYVDTSITQRINILPGVSQVQIFSAPKAIRIEIDLKKLYARNLTVEDVATAVQQNTVLLSTGILKGNSKTMTILVDGQLMKAKQYGDSIITTRNNIPIYLRDVATCVDSVSSTDTKINYWSSYHKDFNSFLVLGVYRTSNANTTDVAKAIQTLLPQLQVELPKAITIIPIYDQSESILASIQDVKETILIAFLLVVVVVFLFLGRVKETIIPALAIPLSLFITFIVMHWLGYILDNLSLMAITLAIGFLVDDAIVFLENMVRHMERGSSPMQAAFASAKQISFTILSMTLSLCATFIPLVFMGEQIGRVFREFSVTILISILASGIVSLTLTPMMCANVLTVHTEEKTFFERFSLKFESLFLKFYDRTLDWFLSNKWLSLATWVICLMGTATLFVMLPKTFLPAGDSGFIKALFLAKEGTSPETMHRLQDKADAVIRSHPAVNHAVSVSSPPFGSSNQCFAFIILKPKKERVSLATGKKNASIETVTTELTHQLYGIPGFMPLLAPMPTLEISTGSVSTNRGKYAYSISGIDQDAIIKASDLLKKRLSSVKGINPMSINCDLELRNPQIDLKILSEKASLMNTNNYTIESTFSYAFADSRAYTVKAASSQYDVIVRALQSQAKDTSHLNLLYLRDATNKGLIPLSSITSAKPSLGPIAVNHIDNLKSATIFFNIFPGAPIGSITEQVEKIAEECVPPGLLHEFEGEAANFQKTTRDLTILIIVAIFVMYIILGILYENFIHPLTVLSTLPVALVGGLMTLHIFNAEFSLYAFIGLFMLMGIIKKNGIMLIDFAIEKVNAGIPAHSAIHQACLERFRPIMMTTLSTLAGAVPIACGWGADGVSRMPLGLTVIGGLTFAQLLTLYVTPVIYLVFEKLNFKTGASIKI